MKKTINFILIIMMLLLNITSVFASESDVKVYVNDKLSDAYINIESIKDGKIESLQDAFEKIGASLKWDEINNCIYIDIESLENFVDIEKLKEFAEKVLAHWLSVNNGGVAPTATPTPLPTTKPTVSPKPTPVPTPVATPTPSPVPTPVPTAVPTQPPSIGGVPSNELAKQVFELVNVERAKHGLSALKYTLELEAVAYAHSKDMADNGYFDHTNLRGQSPFDRLRNAGISYTRAAENIAAGQRSAESVMNSWMNSQGHRENILNPNLAEIGIGVHQGGSYGIYWTQLFITK